MGLADGEYFELDLSGGDMDGGGFSYLFTQESFAYGGGDGYFFRFQVGFAFWDKGIGEGGLVGLVLELYLAEDRYFRGIELFFFNDTCVGELVLKLGDFFFKHFLCFFGGIELCVFTEVAFGACFGDILSCFGAFFGFKPVEFFF